MAEKPREKMSMEERAKQFSSFAALKGLDSALRRKEWEVEERIRARTRIVKED